MKDNRALEKLKHQLQEYENILAEGQDQLRVDIERCRHWAPLMHLIEEEEETQRKIAHTITQARIESMSRGMMKEDSEKSRVKAEAEGEIERLQRMLEESEKTKAMIGEVIEARLETVNLITEKRFALEDLTLKIRHMKETVEAYRSR